MWVNIFHHSLLKSTRNCSNSVSSSPKLHKLSEFLPNKILWHKQTEDKAVYQNEILCQKPYGIFQVSCYLAWKIVKVEWMGGAIPLLPHMPLCCGQGRLHLSLYSAVICTSGLPAVLISSTASTGATPQCLYCRYTGGGVYQRKRGTAAQKGTTTSTWSSAWASHCAQKSGLLLVHSG
jgi:hypothetical protein